MGSASRWITASFFALAVMAPAFDAAAQAAPSAPEGIAVGEFALTPSVQLRTRGEFRHAPVDMGGRNGNPPSTAAVENAWLVSERARVGLGVEHGALKAQVTLQDARAWGSPSLGSFSPFEAYGEVRTQSARPSYLRIGRQAIQWGDGRLLGTADWHPRARSLDAVRGKAALGPVDVEALAAMLDLPQPSSPSFGQTGFTGDVSGTQLYGLLVAWPIDPLLRVEASGLARVARSVDTTVGSIAGTSDPASRFAEARIYGETYTADLRVSGETHSFRYGVEGAYQFGTARRFGLDRAAYAAAAYAGYTFEDVLLMPALRVGGSIASGDDGRGKYKQFDPLLSDVHTHYGAMDAFAWSNVAEVNAGATIEPFTDVRFGLEYRYARLMEAGGEWLNNYLTNVGSAPGSSETELGHEGDLFFTWLPWSPLDLRAGYSMLLLGDGARTVQAAEARGASAVSHFAYLQATLIVP